MSAPSAERHAARIAAWFMGRLGEEVGELGLRP